MNASQTFIAEVLDNVESTINDLDETLLLDKNITAKILSFREGVIKTKTTSLAYIGDEISKTILLNSDENILPALKDLADSSDFKDAVVLIFTDGQINALMKVETQDLMKRLIQSQSQFHVFYDETAFCRAHVIIAVDKKSELINQDGERFECDLRGRNASFQYWNASTENQDKLSKLAYETGGLVWGLNTRQMKLANIRSH